MEGKIFNYKKRPNTFLVLTDSYSYMGIKSDLIENVCEGDEVSFTPTYKYIDKFEDENGKNVLVNGLLLVAGDIRKINTHTLKLK